MRYFYSFLFTVAAFGLQAQLTTLNPTTFPFDASDMYIFDDGSAYFTTMGSNYIVECSDIENPVQAKYRYIYIDNFEFNKIICTSKSNCVARGGRGTSPPDNEWFRTFDGGKTWQKIKVKLHPLDNPVFVTNTFWLADRKGKVRASVDWGNTWRSYDTVRYYRYMGKENGSALMLNVDSNWVHRLSRGSFRFVFDPEKYRPNSHPRIRAIIPYENGYLTWEDSGKVYQYDLNTQSASLKFRFSNYPRMRSYGDTLIINDGRRLVRSFDNGLSWRSDSTDSYLQLGDHYYNGKLYAADIIDGIAGVYTYFDIARGSDNRTAGNTYDEISSLLEPKGENEVFFATHKWQANGTSYHAYSVNKNGKRGQQYSLPYPYSYPQLTFADSLNGAIFGQAFTIPYTYDLSITSDGGQTYTTVWSDSLYHKHKLSAPIEYAKNAQCLIAASKDKKVMFINRQGQLLYKKEVPRTTTGRRIKDLYFKDCNEGLVVTKKAVYHTDDGGNSFKETLKLGFGEVVNNASITDTGVWVVTYQKVYYAPGLSDSLKAVQALSKNFPYVQLWMTRRPAVFNYNHNKHELYYSSDTGKTFQGGRMPTEGIRDIVQTNDTTYLISAFGGVLHRLYLKDSLIINASDPGVGLEEEVSSEIYVYPNPTQREVYLKLPHAGKHRISIYSLGGELVKEQKVYSQRPSFNIADIPAGTYVLKIQGKNWSKSFKILKLE